MKVSVWMPAGVRAATIPERTDQQAGRRRRGLKEFATAHHTFTSRQGGALKVIIHPDHD
jgi:hypothetical protein